MSVIPIGPPVVIITGASYFASAIGMEDYGFLISIVSIFLMFIINVLGMEVSSKIQGALSVVCLIIFLGIIVVGIINLDKADPVNISSLKLSDYSLSSVFSALAMTFWCFVGIEAVSHLAGEFKDVKRDFPRTIIFSVIIVGFLYLSVGIIVFLFNAYGNSSINDNSLVYLLSIFYGGIGKFVIGILGFITCILASNLYILSSSRLLMALNKGNKFSKVIKGNVPIYSLIVSFLAVLVTVTLRFKFKIDLSELINYANGVFILIYLFVMLAGIKLLSGVKKVLSIISFFLCFIILFSIGKHAIYGIAVFGFILAGIVLHRKFK